jgi:hypothetical protein
MFGGLAVDLIGVSQSQEPAQGFLIFGGDVDGGEMTAAVEPSEHHRIEAIGFSTIAGFARDERWCNDFAVETVAGEHSLKNEAAAGGFVTAPNGSPLRQTAKQATNLHEITGELDNLGILSVTLKNSDSDRIEMDIETNPYILIHGWTPPRKSLSATNTRVALFWADLARHPK